MDNWALGQTLNSAVVVAVHVIPPEEFLAFVKYQDRRASPQKRKRRRMYYYESGRFVSFDPNISQSITTDFLFMDEQDGVEGPVIERDFPLSREPFEEVLAPYEGMFIEGPRHCNPFVSFSVDTGQTLVSQGYCVWDIDPLFELKDFFVEEKKGRSKVHKRYVHERLHVQSAARGLLYAQQILYDTARRVRTRFEAMVCVDADIVNYHDTADDMLYLNARRVVAPFSPSARRSELVVQEGNSEWQELLQRAMRGYNFCFAPTRQPIVF